jgi:alpha-tubulin suppressor-like RCC1 family protein
MRRMVSLKLDLGLLMVVVASASGCSLNLFEGTGVYCDTTSNCPDNQTCCNGECHRTCDTESCPPGQERFAEGCVVLCNTDEECKTEEVCSFGICRTQCTSNGGCLSLAPVISTFTATPSTIAVGAPTSVIWAWTYDKTPIPTPACVVDHGVGTVANGTVTSVTLSTDTLFALTCTNTVGSATKTTTIFMGSVPAQPSTIMGNASPCQGATAVVYSVSNVADVSYDWAYSGAGATITAGAGTSTLAVDYSGSATSGAWTVTPSNVYGNGTARTLAVTIETAPTQPSVITGSTAPYDGSSQSYSVTNVAGATYSWTFPVGWTQTGGGTTSSVTVTVGVSSGTIRATPSNGCGSGPTRTLTVNVTELEPFVQVAAGVYHTCGITGKGQAFCWGSDSDGQLGDDATLAAKHIPTAVAATSLPAGDKAFVRLAVGNAHTCGITGEGQAFCWGDDVYGQLGDDATAADKSMPTAVDATNLPTDDKALVQLGAGLYHTCGITGKGKALCWGSDSSGQLGDDATLADKHVPTVVATTNLPADDKAFVQIATGGVHTCGITGKGKAFCWGDDSDGQLGDDAALAEKTIPTAVATTDLPADDKVFVQLAAGTYHTCGLTGKGKAFCWGDDAYGQLGDDATLAGKHVPTAVDTTNLPADDKAFVQIATGGAHTCGITGKGQAFCWGDDGSGQLGDDVAPANRSVPTAVAITNLPVDDKAFVWLATGYVHTCGITGGGKAFCWGYDSDGQLGDGAAIVSKPTPSAVDTANLSVDDRAFVQIAPGYLHTCGITGGGKAFCWGDDSRGQLGDDAAYVDKPMPTPVATTNLPADDKAFVQLAAGAYNTCGITGKGKAFCWGDDAHGQLGDDAITAEKPIPTAVATTNLPTDDKAFVRLASGYFHVCGITGGGRAFCWGDDSDGQLGDDATLAVKRIPTAVATTNLPADNKAFVQLTAGGAHTCGITGKGQAFCWGDDAYYQLGDDSSSADKSIPTAVDTTNLSTDDKAFVQLAAGLYHTCGITGGGKAFCWGDDSGGQLGDDASPVTKPVPTAVATTDLPADDKAFVQLATGIYHTCGTTGKGQAFCWGDDGDGQLGDGATLANKPTPTAANTSNLPADDKAFVQLAASAYHTCGLTGKGQAFCWGDDSGGQLGNDATLADKPVPTAVDLTSL